MLRNGGGQVRQSENFELSNQNAVVVRHLLRGDITAVFDDINKSD